jgi:hypothetical protein
MRILQRLEAKREGKGRDLGGGGLVVEV